MNVREVLLLGPANSTHMLQWRRAIADEVGRCVLASLHPLPPRGDVDTDLVFLPGATHGPLAVRMPASLRSLQRLLTSHRFDLVFAYYLSSYGLLASFALPGRYVAVAAGSDIFPTRLRSFRTWASSRSLRHAAFAVAWTSPMAERMTALGARRDRLLVCPRGIDLEIFRPDSAIPANGGLLRIVSTRRLRPLFRIDVLIEAVAELKRSGVPVRLEVLGGGSERNRLERMVQRLDLQPSVFFLGHLSPARVAERLRDADVIVSLSESDGLSTSLVEAMACGVFPIVSDIPANRELVRHGRNGLLVRGDRAEEVANSLRLAMTDLPLRQEARVENLKRARELFDLRKNTRTILVTAARSCPPAWSAP